MYENPCSLQKPVHGVRIEMPAGYFRNLTRVSEVKVGIDSNLLSLLQNDLHIKHH